MSIVHSPTHLPVFHHIAKNAGTYVLSWAQMLCRKYHMMRGDNRSWHWTSAKIRRGLITLIDGRQLTIIYFTPTDLTGSNLGIFSLIPGLEQESKDDKRRLVLNAQLNYINGLYPSGGDEVTNIIPEEDFLNFIKNGDVIPFCVIIDPMDSGWKEARLYIDKILEASKRNSCLYFTVLRNPYNRAQSLFHYLKGEESSHEPTHNLIQAKSFQDYIQSDEIEDSWFLRSILDMPNDQVIEPYHLTLTDEWLRHFRISDTSKVDDLINNVFHGAYGILQSDVEDHIVKSNLHRNATPNKLTIKFEDLDPTVQQNFLDRTYWDRKLWERYCKNVDIPQT